MSDRIPSRLISPAVNGDGARLAASGTPGQAGPPLLLELNDAARFLAVSPRTLWGLTSPRGPIRAVRIGRAVRYDRRELVRFVDGLHEAGDAAP